MFEITRNRIPVIGSIGLAGVFIFAGCIGQKYDLQATDAMPGAVGTVSISKDNLSDTIIEINAQNLVALDEDQEDARYVAWTQFQNDSIKLGNLNVVGGNGRLISKTKLKQFEVLVTSEELSSATVPASDAILRTLPIVLD